MTIVKHYGTIRERIELLDDTVVVIMTLGFHYRSKTPNDGIVFFCRNNNWGSMIQ